MSNIESPSASPLPHSSLPQDPAEFDSDPRISFSKLSNKFILETDDGQEFEFDETLKRWIPVLDEALLEQQRAAYAVQGVDESEPAQTGTKRKKAVYTNGEDESGGRLNTKKSKPTPEARERKNTAVYITNLPLNTTVEEVHDVFSRCGVIAEEIDRGKPRIKLYTDEAGNFKGDALILYFRAESVDLAIQMLDDSDFRLGERAPGGRMRVTAADFSYKNQKEAPAKSNAKDKRKIIKKTQKLNNKLADWDDDDPQTLQETSSKWDKVVILKHMFTLQELDEDPAAILDIKEDIRDECSKMGDVTNIVLFDKEPDGVASVRFANAEAAKACVRLMHTRHFSGQAIEAYIADGSEKFRKSTDKKSAVLVRATSGGGDGDGNGNGNGNGDMEGEGDEGDEEGRRLDQFGKWLEEEEEIMGGV